MTVVRDYGKNFVVLKHADEPIDARYECGQEYFERRDDELAVLEEVGIARDGNHFSDQGDKSQEIADPQFGPCELRHGREWLLWRSLHAIGI